jgi:hypothetical protein
MSQAGQIVKLVKYVEEKKMLESAVAWVLTNTFLQQKPTLHHKWIIDAFLRIPRHFYGIEDVLEIIDRHLVEEMAALDIKRVYLLKIIETEGKETAGKYHTLLADFYIKRLFSLKPSDWTSENGKNLGLAKST